MNKDNNRDNKSLKLVDRKVILIEQHLKNDVVLALKRFKVPLPVPNKYRVIHSFKNNDSTLVIHTNKNNEFKAVLSRPKDNKYWDWSREIMFDIFLSLQNNSLLNPLFTIGSDEVAKSDYLGPLVVASTAWKDSKHIFNSGEKDSKKMSFQECVEFEEKITKSCLHSFSLISPKKMNNFMKNTGEKLNLNHLLVYYHVVCNSNVHDQVAKNKQDKMFFAIDDFLNSNPNLEKKYFKDLSNIPEIRNFSKKDIPIRWIIKGDEKNDLIKLASIHAKYIFQLEMKKIFSEISRHMDIGNSFKVVLGNSNALRDIIFNLTKLMPKAEMKRIVKPLYWKKFNLD